MALIHFYSNILKNIDQSKTVIGVLCYLENSFDCVQHDSLIQIMELYDVKAVPAHWFASYLKDRVLLVKLRVFKPGFEVVTTFQLQMVFLNVLFLDQYINDIVLFLSDVCLRIYVDDISILVTPISDKKKEMELYANKLIDICISGLRKANSQ